VERLKILFICVGNTCRSPMAEALARGIGADRVEAFSAGLTPTGWISRDTASAVRELGYDPEGLRSKGLDDVGLADMDVVVSLIGPEGLCFIPRNMGARLESWRIPDPFGEDIEVFVAVARRLERQIRELLAEVL
jgi:arsenate reductase